MPFLWEILFSNMKPSFLKYPHNNQNPSVQIPFSHDSSLTGPISWELIPKNSKRFPEIPIIPKDS